MHAKEPWFVSNNGGIDQLIEDANGRVVVYTIGNSGQCAAEKEANASRITACVNACGGVSTEDLQILVEGGDTFATVRDRHKAQIDALSNATLQAVPAEGLVWVCLNAHNLPTSRVRSQVEELNALLTKEKADGKTNAQFILTVSLWPDQMHIQNLPDEELERVGLVRTYVAKGLRDEALDALEKLAARAECYGMGDNSEAYATAKAVLAKHKGGSV